MAKITLQDGTVIEGTIEEFAQMGVKFPGGEVVAEEQDVISHKGVEYKRVDRKARKGDVVVFTENESACLKNGVTYGPVGLNNLKPKIVGGDGDSYSVYFDYMNRTESNVKVYEPVAKEQPLKVGDYAKIVGKDKTRIDRGSHGFNEGETVKLVRELHNRSGFECESLTCNASAAPYVSTPDLVRATDEEVAKAKRQQAEQVETERWTKIGRKPNEFKQGDIVRGERYNNTSVKFFGEVENANNDDNATVQGVRTYDGKYHAAKNVELITPVEHRFDLSEGDAE